MYFTEQFSAVWAIVLLIAHLFGVTIGVVGGAVLGSKRGALLWPAADNPLSAGARVIHGVYIRNDGVCRHRTSRYYIRAPGDPRRPDSSGSDGQEVD